MADQMLIDDIPVNYKVPPEDRLRLHRQARQIYEMLKKASAQNCFISNLQMSRVALKYTSRVSEIRVALEKIGQTVKCIKGKKGLCYYAIVDIE